MQQTHKLKILNKYAILHLQGKKNWEIRKNDRDFKVGDLIEFTIIDEIIPIYELPTTYVRQIDYIFEGGQYGLEQGYCILSIS